MEKKMNICAVTAEVDFLVTGDKRHLQVIGDYEGVRIISPTTFLIILEGSIDINI